MTDSIQTQWLQTNVLVIDGGTAGPMAGLKAKQANPERDVCIYAQRSIQKIQAVIQPAANT
ncbi:MAG: hypothetical protein J0L70_29185 [Leptolyngbya sp. UWPOB_LEPTO1]|uniref:hypothetical protein n=1 Tax=Leptolyngbya sp. UWPOB_LEPTO1 TaxID=2815653 RepID=UPI001AC639DF|nr:hypothetical protein [Leptolyngbya sp. UWPOB_LEPTO1]MBN8564610.1 hypothetical protein [Leptolyngbya sp. UWPOB_LEPTO1]